MKFFQMYGLICLISLSACTTATRIVTGKSVQVGLTELERLRPGHATTREIKEILGKPEQTIALSGTEESWVYRELHGTASWERASFTVDNRNGAILSSVLLLSDTDPLHDLDHAIRYFEKSHFTVKGDGWIKGHEFSEDSEYSDTANGISMRVKRAPRTVSEISFWLPSHATAPLAELGKSL